MSRSLRLTTLGGLALLADARPLGAAAGQRRPLAVLALLAASGEIGMSRSKLTAILWPDAEPERARQTLAQTLYSLRRATGVEELCPGVGDVRLNEQLVSCDLIEFEAALRAGRLEDAVALYRGPFLDGFHLPGADDFDRWVEGERQRVAGRYAAALRELAARAAATGDVTAAVERWRRLVAVDPLDATATLALVDALGRAGDLPGAERAARVHEALVREQLDLPLAPAIGARLAALRADAAARAVPAERETVRHGAAVATPDAASRAPDDASLGGGAHAARPAPAGWAPEEDRSPSRTGAPPARPRRGPRGAARGLALLAGGLLLTGLGVALGVTFGRVGVRETSAAPARPAAAGLVAVLPFANETADPSLAELGVGTAALLSRMLSGSVGPRAVDHEAVRASLARDADARGVVDRATARGVGAALGADEVLVGRVAGSADRLELRAALVGVRNGAERVSAVVAGPADSLPALADALAAALLAGREMGGDRRGAFAGRSLRELQTYLQAEEAVRTERFHRAIVLYSRGLEHDSTFAPAALGLALAADRLDAAEPHARGLALAWAARDRLGERDRARLLALTGPRFPAPSPASEQLGAWERAVSVAPDRASSWSRLGERYFYDGAALGVRNWPDRAAAAFRRALELDPLDAAATRHLIELAARAGDRARLATLATPERRREAGPHLAGYLAWRVAQARGDTAALARMHDSLPSFGPPSLRAIAVAAQHDGVALADGERALRYLGARAALASEQLDVLLAQHSLALNTGRSVRALDVTEQLQDVRPRGRAHQRLRVLDALHAEGDTAAASAAARELADVRAPAAGAGERERAVWLADACVLAQWRTAHLSAVSPAEAPKAVAAIRRAADALRAAAAPRVSVPIATAPRACAELVDAMLAVALHAPDARARVDRLAAMTLAGPALGDASTYAMIAVARLYERLGRPDRALAAVRQRPYLKGWPRYLATALAQEGRLALAVGDEAGALAAFDRYLALRADPEARLRPDVDAVRATAAALRAEHAAQSDGATRP